MLKQIQVKHGIHGIHGLLPVEILRNTKTDLGTLRLLIHKQIVSLGRRSFADKQALPNNGYDAKCAIAAGAGGLAIT